MKILVCEHGIEKLEIEKLLDEYQIVIIENKYKPPEKLMSNVIIRDENTVFAFHYILKGNKKYHFLANVRKLKKNNEDKVSVFHVPMPAREIAEKFENTIEYK